jgi:2-amino-4-hydroxy-6-hydroxymethyldihydropteridine diphosphokinase
MTIVLRPARQQAAIGLGSNLGNSVATLESALTILAQTPGIQVLAHSPWYRTQPIGPPQPDFCNGCAILAVQLTPQALLAVLLSIEAQLGRVREQHWGPRTLDLDLLLFDQFILDVPTLQLPHPRLQERAFVLVPLADIAPDWIEPRSQRTIAMLRQAVDCSGIRQWEAS